MRVYLMRHGDAVEKAVDPDRPLSEEGTHSVDVVGTFLREKVTVGEIWHSGKLRAEQTAQRLAMLLGNGTRLVRKEDLRPSSPAQPTAGGIAQAQGDVMIVGHMPHLGKLASLLVCGEENIDVVIVEKATVVCLERGDTAFAISWSVTPHLLGA